VSVRIGNEQYTLAVNSGTSIYYNQEITVEAVMDAAGNLVLQVEGCVKPSTVYINDKWDWNTPKNTVMTLADGGTAVYGYDAFREGKDGFDVLAPGGTLVVEKGKLEDRNFYDAQSVVFLGEGELGTARINSGATITAKAGSTLKCTSTKLYFNSGSTLTVEAGAVLTGTAYFDEGSVITVDGTLEFDISRINGNSKTVLFTNLSLVGGNTAYRLKTVGWESEGEYILASGAADFDGTISVVKNDVEIGTLTVGGRFFSDGKYYYLTRKDNGNLVFSQSDRPVISQAYVNPGWATLEDGTVVQINGATATIGYDAFADVDTALTVLPENATLNVTGGTVTSFGGGVKKNVAVWDGACLTNVTINSATLTLESGASARNIIIGYTDYNPFTGDISSYKSGELLAKSGAAMQDITFLAGSMTLKGNASIRNLQAGMTTDTFATPSISTITSTSDVVLSGTITLRKDVVLRGGATFADDAVITVDGTLAFDISGMTAGDGAQYRGLSMVYGTPNFTLTVGGSQGLGKYALADGVSEFNSTITVTNATGASLGTLRLNSVLHIGDVNYRLTLNDGVLSVDVFKPTEALARSDVDGNGVSDVLFQYTGGDNQTGYWMNGRDAWRSTNMPHPAEWTLLGAYDMDCDGIADSVFVGNGVELNGKKGAYIGYYKGGVDTDDNWMNIHFLENEEENVWANKIGNLTGNVGANSIVWHCAGLGALGVWTDGTSDWISLGGGFDSNWTMIGCGDFNGDGRDSVVMSYLGGVKYYAIGLDGSAVDMGSLNWGGWEVRAIGDFAGDSKDDMVLFHKETGVVVMLADGNLNNYTSIGQLDAKDWFIVGAGDYDGDRKDDLLVRQYSTGMLGYYSACDTSKWVEMGRGVDMDWTVIA
ncbi:MAG: hypothetical protein IKC53_08745, partial [Lentisphaeria bacterium]|nr:hypothetical protein [Lentisphaeria bacterium]